MLDLTKLNLMNSAGECKTLEGVARLCKTPVTEITVGSITLQPREVNSGIVLQHFRNFSLNSLGLPNMGLNAFLKELPEMRAMTRAAGKRLRINVAGFSPREYCDLALAVLPQVDVVELNLGCPNVWGSSGQKPIASFNIDVLEETFALLYGGIDLDLPGHIAAKYSPYSDPKQLADTLELQAEYSAMIPEAVMCNTLPNGFALMELTDRPAITPGGGFAGVSGECLRPIALGQAKAAHAILAPRGSVTLVGGVSTGVDIVDAMHCGINSVQVGTHWMRFGDRVFSELLSEASRGIDLCNNK